MRMGTDLRNWVVQVVQVVLAAGRHRPRRGSALLTLRVRDGARCATVEQKTRVKIMLVEEKLRELERLKQTLDELAASCRARRVTSDCPVLDALEEDNAVNGK